MQLMQTLSEGRTQTRRAGHEPKSRKMWMGSGLSFLQITKEEEEKSKQKQKPSPDIPRPQAKRPDTLSLSKTK